MENFQKILLEENYKKIKFKVSKSQHLLINAKINGVKGTFILDTGASNSCVGFVSVSTFGLRLKNTNHKVSGVNSLVQTTQISKYNKIQIGNWKVSELHLVVFDLTHVNDALKSFIKTPIDGILGADILQKGKAIIDYPNKKLYLK